MKFRFIGKGSDSPRKILFMGTEKFVLDEVTDVQDTACIQKLKINPCFELVQDDVPGTADAVEDSAPVAEVVQEMLEIPALKTTKKANKLFTPESSDSE